MLSVHFREVFSIFLDCMLIMETVLLADVSGGPVIRGSGGGEFEFAAGDTVRVDLDVETAKLMQEGHGGWIDAMTDVRDSMLYKI